MSLSLKSKFIVTLVKFALLTLPLSAIAVFLFRGNVLIRDIIVLAIFAAGFITVRKLRRSKSSSCNEIGYWSGLDDFEIGIDDECFNDLDFTDEDIDLSPEDHYTEKPV